MRKLPNYAKLCGNCQIMQNRTDRTKRTSLAQTHSVGHTVWGHAPGNLDIFFKDFCTVMRFYEILKKF